MTQKEKIKKKNEIQSKAVAMSLIERFLCLEWCTGVGKSLASIKILQEIYSLNQNIHCYIICKENSHKKNWIDEFKKHKKEHLLKNVTITLYSSMHKETVPADLIIMDECHALTGPRIVKLRPILNKNTRIVFLSATINDKKRVLIENFCKSLTYYSISLFEAIKMGLVPEPKLFVHSVKLDPNNPETHDLVVRKPKVKESNLFKRCSFKTRVRDMKSIPKEYGVIAECNEYEYYEAITEQMEYFKSVSEDYSKEMGLRRGCRNKYLNLATQRKKFLGKVKGRHVQQIVEKFRSDNKRFICFTGSVEQAISLGSNAAIHSKNRKEKNQSIIDCFNRKECSELFAVKMLRESVNLTDIEKGVITQLDSEIGSFYQMLGRALRHEFPEMHIFVIEKTKDVSYLNNALVNFDNKYVTKVNG